MGTKFSAPVQTGPGPHPAFCTMGTGSFPGGIEQPGRDADPSSPSSAVGHERVELYLYCPCGPYGLYRALVPVQGGTLPYSRAIPLLPLWAVRPVQSLSACTRVHFTFTDAYSECVILIACLRQQWLRERASMLFLQYIASLLFFFKCFVRCQSKRRLFIQTVTGCS